MLSSNAMEERWVKCPSWTRTSSKNSFGLMCPASGEKTPVSFSRPSIRNFTPQARGIPVIAPMPISLASAACVAGSIKDTPTEAGLRSLAPIATPSMTGGPYIPLTWALTSMVFSNQVKNFAARTLLMRRQSTSRIIVLSNQESIPPPWARFREARNFG